MAAGLGYAAVPRVAEGQQSKRSSKANQVRIKETEESEPMAKETINNTKADETTAWRLRLAATQSTSGAFMLSQCVSVTTKGPPQGQLGPGTSAVSNTPSSRSPCPVPQSSPGSRQAQPHPVRGSGEV